MGSYNPYVLQMAQWYRRPDDVLEVLGYSIAVVGYCLEKDICADRRKIEQALREPSKLADDGFFAGNADALRELGAQVEKLFKARLGSLLLNDMRRLGLLEVYRVESGNVLRPVGADDAGWPQGALVRPGPLLPTCRRALEACIARAGEPRPCFRLVGALALVLFAWFDRGSKVMHSVLMELLSGGDLAVRELARTLSKELSSDIRVVEQKLRGMLVLFSRALDLVEEASRGPLRGVVPVYYLPLRRKASIEGGAV